MVVLCRTCWLSPTVDKSGGPVSCSVYPCDFPTPRTPNDVPVKWRLTDWHYVISHCMTLVSLLHIKCDITSERTSAFTSLLSQILLKEHPGTGHCTQNLESSPLPMNSVHRPTPAMASCCRPVRSSQLARSCSTAWSPLPTTSGASQPTLAPQAESRCWLLSNKRKTAVDINVFFSSSWHLCVRVRVWRYRQERDSSLPTIYTNSSPRCTDL